MSSFVGIKHVQLKYRDLRRVRIKMMDTCVRNVLVFITGCFCICTTIAETTGVDTCCVRQADTLLCESCIPVIIPEGVVNVQVVQNRVPIDIRTFAHSSWQWPHYLDITEEEVVSDHLEKRVFYNLKSVKYLGLHLPAFFDNSTIDKDAFSGLDAVSHLNVTNCERFSFDMFYEILLNRTNLRGLKVLNMGKFNSLGNGSPLDLNKSVMAVLGHRKIESLNADGSTISTIYMDPYSPFCSSMKMISLRNAKVLNVTQILELRKCYSLKEVDMSGIFLPVTSLSEERTPTIIINETDRLTFLAGIYYFANVKSLNLNRMTNSKPFLPVKYILIFEPKITLAVNELYARDNKLSYLDVEWHTSKFVRLHLMDLGNNQMEYISPKFFANFSSIKTLFLDKNNLYKMAIDRSSEFEHIFIYLTYLTTIDLSANYLSTIPQNMFSRNKHISRVNLSRNRLYTFIQQYTACQLTSLDLSNNMVKQLDSKSMDWFDSINNANKNQTFILKLQDNAFQCSCKDLTFAYWLLYSKYIERDSSLLCGWQGLVSDLTNITIQSMKNDCTSVSLIWLYFVIGICFVTSVAGFIGYKLYAHIRRIRTRTQRIQNTITMMQNEELPYTYTAFLIFSSLDDDIVLNHFCPALEQTMYDLVGDVPYGPCTGDGHFHLGKRILDEQTRCLRESAVTLALVSQNFCNSAYCHDEVRIAAEMDKPIFLVMLEQVHECQMSEMFKELFKRNVRGKMSMVQGQPEFTPAMSDIALSMLEMVQ